MLFVTIIVGLVVVGQIEATLQGNLLAFINDLRSQHSAGPLISSPTASSLAQKAADKLAKDRDINGIYHPLFSVNHCEYTGKLSKLAHTCTVAWYTTMRDHSWCSPTANGKSRPFVNMIWNTTARAGTGISKGGNGKYYVVTYFSPRKGSDVKGNVHPIKVVTKASDKAKCPNGFTRFGSSCFKFHPEKVSWEHAFTICANENATLTSVRNQKEEKFLRALQEKRNGKGWMWIGLHDRTNEGNFAWLDGLEFASGVCAPVSANGGTSQNCVAWTTNKPISCWSDKKCSDSYSFMCRVPVDGKSTFRTQILFKKFRWNPNFRDKNSKAFRDLRRGLQVTFKELFQRSSGRIGGGFRALKIKDVKPLSIKGKHRGTAVTLSLQFRAKIADPTLKFQKFLRPSERLISISVDSPVVHNSAIARTMCSFPCKRSGHHYCHQYYGPQHGHNTGTYNTVYQHARYTNTGYPSYTTSTGYPQCPSSCAQYTYNNCPSYCQQSCCTYTASPTALPPTATQPPTTPKPLVTAVVHTGKRPVPPTNPPEVNKWGGYSSYQPYSQCNSCQNLYTSPMCYAFCDEKCCKHSNDENRLKKKVQEIKKEFKTLKAMIMYDNSGNAFADNGNAIPMSRSQAMAAMRNLKKNIMKLKAKIKSQQSQNGDKFFEQEIQNLEKQSGNENAIPNFERELSDLEKGLNAPLDNNGIPSKVVDNGDDKKLENFDIEPLDLAKLEMPDMDVPHSEQTTLEKQDKELPHITPAKVEKTDMDFPHIGPAINMSYNNKWKEKIEKEKEHARNEYKGPTTSESSHSTRSYKGPRTDPEYNWKKSAPYPIENTVSSSTSSSHNGGINGGNVNETYYLGTEYNGPKTNETYTSGARYNGLNTGESSKETDHSAPYNGPKTNETYMSRARYFSKKKHPTNESYGGPSIDSNTDFFEKSNNTYITNSTNSSLDGSYSTNYGPGRMSENHHYEKYISQKGNHQNDLEDVSRGSKHSNDKADRKGKESTKLDKPKLDASTTKNDITENEIFDDLSPSEDSDPGKVLQDKIGSNQRTTANQEIGNRPENYTIKVIKNQQIMDDIEHEGRQSTMITDIGRVHRNMSMKDYDTIAGRKQINSTETSSKYKFL